MPELRRPSPFTSPLPLSQRLSVMADETPIPLPGWAGSLVALGEYLTDLPDAHPPVTVVVELPTRRYAALFVALGVIASRQTRPVYSLQDFDALAASSRPVNVRYRYQSVAFDGVVEGAVDRSGEPHLIIRRPSGECHYLPRSLNSQLIGIGKAAQLSERHRDLQFGGKHLKKEWDFAATVFSSVDPSDYLLADRQDVILFGPADPLRWEARLPLAVNDASGAWHVGELREAVRVRDWRDQGSVNAELFPVASDMEGHTPDEDRFFPSIAVFDGGLAYANWRYLISGHHVALLTPGRTGYQQGDLAMREAFYSGQGRVPLPPAVTGGFAANRILAFKRLP